MLGERLCSGFEEAQIKGYIQNQQQLGGQEFEEKGSF